MSVTSIPFVGTGAAALAPVGRSPIDRGVQPAQGPAQDGGEDPITRQIRFRRAATVGYVTWMSFSLADWGAVRYLHAGRLGYFLLLRAILLVAYAPVLVRVHRGPTLAPRTLFIVELVAYCATAIEMALMCVAFQGLASPYVPGFGLCLLARSISTHGEPWKRGVLVNLILLACFFAVLLGAALFSPRIVAQLHDPASIATGCLYTSYLLGTCVSIVVGGHLTWSLRGQVFEARNLGRYRLKRPIGKGATGEVWLAHHAALKRDVAVKILRPEVVDPVSIARFDREARATAELGHPNTVRILDFGTTEDGLWYYAMELLEGRTLDALVAAEGPLPPGRAIHLALQASRALAEAHGRGIVHRDVKPSNLFVATMGGEGDLIKVLDFGIARLRSGASSTTLTSTGSILGTPAYISPEAALCEDVDARADVYGMGAVLYFMLTGKPPFEPGGDGAVGVMLAHVSREPVPPSVRLGVPLPSGVEGVVMRCLRKEREARYADAAQLAAALRTC